MPASRWHSNPVDLFEWMDEDDAELVDMFLPSIFARFSQTQGEEPKSDATPQPAGAPDAVPAVS